MADLKEACSLPGHMHDARDATATYRRTYENHNAAYITVFYLSARVSMVPTARHTHDD